MSPLLEMPEIRRQAFAVSVDAYHRLADGQPTELLRGTIIQKVSKSPVHNLATYRLHQILSGQVSPNFLVFQEAPISTIDSEPEPDLAVVHGPEQIYASDLPKTAELVVEVAITSLEIDRVKALIYAEAGVKEYWIVCPSLRQIEVYRQPKSDGYAERITVAAPAVLECQSLPGVRVELGELFK
jgi:Uma2 family endonuclease